MKKITLTILIIFWLFIPTTSFSYTGDPITITGKITEKNEYGITISVDDDVPHYVDIDNLKDTTADFRQCIENGKYKGIIEITAITGSMRADSTDLELDGKSICKRK